MATVHLQPDHARFTGGERVVEVDGATVGALIEALEGRYPGLGPLLTEGSSVAVDGELVPAAHYHPVGPDTEVHFIALISGG